MEVSRSADVQIVRRPSNTLSDVDVYAHAMYDFEATQPGELAFLAGDIVKLVQPLLVGSEACWVTGENPRSGKKGEIPSNYLTCSRGYSASLDAFVNMDRVSAEGFLGSASCNKMNYILRPSSDGDAMALSVKLPTGGFKHFKIFFNIQTETCYVFEKPQFDTIEKLIIFYQKNELLPGVILWA